MFICWLSWFTSCHSLNCICQLPGDPLVKALEVPLVLCPCTGRLEAMIPTEEQFWRQWARCGGRCVPRDSPVTMVRSCGPSDPGNHPHWDRAERWHLLPLTTQLPWCCNAGKHSHMRLRDFLFHDGDHTVLWQYPHTVSTLSRDIPRGHTLVSTQYYFGHGRDINWCQLSHVSHSILSHVGCYLGNSRWWFLKWTILVSLQLENVSCWQYIMYAIVGLQMSQCQSYYL